MKEDQLKINKRAIEIIKDHPMARCTCGWHGPHALDCEVEVVWQDAIDQARAEAEAVEDAIDQARAEAEAVVDLDTRSDPC